jgi:hypothetical protein
LRRRSPPAAHRARGGGFANSQTTKPQAAFATLFDQRRPEYPHPSLMPILIQAFFENMQAKCGFLAFDDVIRDFVNNGLSPLLANGLAANGCRSVTLSFRLLKQSRYNLLRRTASLPAFAGRDTDQIADTYCAMAKVSFNASSTCSVLRELHQVIVISSYRCIVNQALRSHLDCVVRT